MTSAKLDAATMNAARDQMLAGLHERVLLLERTVLLLCCAILLPWLAFGILLAFDLVFR